MTAAPIFSIGDGSLVDFNARQIPTFHKTSSVLMENVVDDSIQLTAIAEHHPAFFIEDGSFLLEPAGINLVTHNMDLSQQVWLKGANVNIRQDYSGRGNNAPDGTNTSDRVVWDGGTGATGASQSLRRNFQIEAEREYTLWAILRLQGGLFGAKDFMQVLGDVANVTRVGLSELNQYKGKYTILEVTFRAAGRKPRYPNTHAVTSLPITGVNGSQVDVQLPGGISVAAGAWVGGQLRIEGQLFSILSNDASIGNSVSITLNNATLSALGIGVNDIAQLEEAPAQTITVELYSESTASLDWGGMFLTPDSFRTSPVYQLDNIDVRSATELAYRRSPIAGAKTFVLFGQVNEYRGDGNLLMSENPDPDTTGGEVSVYIEDGRLKVRADAITLTSANELPPNFKFLVQLTEASSSMSLYVNGVLDGRVTISNFAAAAFASMTFTSNGYRRWQRFMVFEEPLLEGQVSIGEAARAEVLELFENPVPISPDTIAKHVPMITLPPVTIPPRPEPIAEQEITNISTAGRTLTVGDMAGFEAESDITIYRDNRVVMRTSIISLNIGERRLNVRTNHNVQVGDVVVYGDRETPGRASVRFPYDPKNTQEVEAINNGLRRLEVSSTLDFDLSKAFIITDDYSNPAEVMIESRDDASGYLFVNDASRISVGDIITQPGNELWVEPANYLPILLERVGGVRISDWYTNGLVLENYTDEPVTVQPAIRVNL